MVVKSIYGSSINDFVFEDKIGQGGFAEVFKARCKRPGFEDTYVAIKKISKKLAVEGGYTKRIENEIDIHSHLPRNSAFVMFHASFEDEKYWYLVLELCEGGSLRKYIQCKKYLSEEEAVNLIKQVIVGVCALHKVNIIHRDLSLGNLLLKDRQEVKIADFGLAKKLNHYNEKTNTVLGTANVMSPEVANHELYGIETDYWSVGCVLYALLYGSLPFNGKTREKTLEKVKYSKLTFPDYASIEAKEVITSLLYKNQELRVKFPSVLQFKLFQKYNKTNERKKVYSQKSSDSGTSSLSSSGSKSLSMQMSSEYSSGSNHHRSQIKRKNKHGKNNSNSRNHDHLSGNTRVGFQYDHVNSEKQRHEYAPYQSRLYSHYETPVKNRPDCPPYPSDLQHLASRNLNAQMCFSDYDSFSSKSHSLKQSNAFEHCNSNRENSYLNNYIDITKKDDLCSHDQSCPPDNNCYKLNCCYRQTRSQQICPLITNATKENKNCMDVKSTVFKKSLKDIMDPLNTGRLAKYPSIRRNINNKVLASILSDGQVCLEYLKLVKEKMYVIRIFYFSANGLQIAKYKPENAILVKSDQEPPPNPHNDRVKYFTFENLPQEYWINYKRAKDFVFWRKRSLPKITIYDEYGRFNMMENTPNPRFEMKFHKEYKGYVIFEEKDKMTVNYKGAVVTINDDNFIVKKFIELKQRCKNLEEYVISNQNSIFPVVLGEKPKDEEVMQDDDKENLAPTCLQSPSRIELNPGVKHCIITIDAENNLLQSTQQRSTSTPYSSSKSTSSFKSITNTLLHVKNLCVKDEWIIAEYEDGIQMWISKQDGKELFKNATTQKQISKKQYPHLKNRKKDVKDILLCALQET